MKNYITILLMLFSVVWAGSAADAAIIVGRISHTEGQIYRYMDVGDSWVETSLQSPAGIEDILLTGADSRAEVAFPNNQLVRMDEATEIEILNLDEDIGEFSLHAGLARFYNSGAGNELLVETSRGDLKVRPGGVIDLRVDTRSVTVAAVNGEAVFYSYDNDEEKVDVISGATSLEFRRYSTIASRGPINLNWDRWCADREDVWVENRLVRSEHLPESMQEYAYVMEPYGRWQRVYYRGYYYWAWSPYSIAVGWSPYTSGYWYDWHGSPVWIDDNPWGGITHHYGSWINLHGSWMWTPYVHVSHVPGVTVIGFDINFGKRFRPHWHPGRVRWITQGNYIGWLPLAPWETYYGYRKWGSRSVVVKAGIGFSLNINLSSHRHIDHAVIIPKRNLYDRRHKAGDYNRVRIHNVRRASILKDYKPIAVTDGARYRKPESRSGPVGNMRMRVEKRPEVNKAVRERKFTVTGSDKKVTRQVVVGRSRTEENNRVLKRQNNRRPAEVRRKVVATVNEKEKIRQRDERNNTLRTHERNLRESIDRNKRASVESRVPVRNNRQNETASVAEITGRTKVRQQAGMRRSKSRIVKQENRTVAARKIDRRDEKSNSIRLPKKQVPEQSRAVRTAKGNKKKYESKKETEEERSRRLAENNSNEDRKRSVFRSRRESGNGSRWKANSFNGRNFR